MISCIFFQASRCMSLRFGIAALAMSFVAFTQRPKDATAAPQGVDNRREGVVEVSVPLVY